MASAAPHSVVEIRDISVSEDSDDQSWHSPINSTTGESCCEIQFSGEIEGVPQAHRDCSESECWSEIEVAIGRDCRICQLEMAGSGDVESRVPMELGCCCKGDLGAAHKQCAETWFKIKGNSICEICGTTALNVATDQINEADNVNPPATSAAPVLVGENRTLLHGRQVMNFVFTCMLIGFVVSWLFHFKLLS